MDSFENCNRHILIIDDDERILDLLRQILILEGFDISLAQDTDQARLVLNSEKIDAMIVDCMLPKENGIEFIKSLRNQGNNIPAVLLTALDNVDNKISGFENGIDDYITKPFDERELIARLKRLLIRTSASNNAPNIIPVGECEFNIITGTLSKHHQIVNLSSTEIALLVALCKTPNSPISRNDLARKSGTIVSDRTIDVQITRLRKKIGDSPKNPTVIQTIRHVGYMLVVETK